MTIYAHNNYLDADLEVVGSYVQSGQDRLIYADALPAFARILKDRIRHNLQNVIVITGGTGSGKSTLAINLCIEVGRALGERWQLAPNYIYSTDDLRAKLRQPDACSSINLFDEGSVSLTVLVPYEKGLLMKMVHERCQVLRERYVQEGLLATVRADARMAATLEPYVVPDDDES